MTERKRGNVGKKRIKIVGEETSKEKGRKIVKTGKEHGRITDMGAIALDEAEKIKERGKELEKLAIAKARKEQKRKKPARKRGKRYLSAKKLVDRTKLYPLPEAIKLAKKTSISHFNGKVEIHLVTKEKGLKKTINLPHKVGKQAELKIATEKKAPLIHLVIGKLDTKDSDLAENFQAIIRAVGTNNIKKAVLTSTMGPGVKVDLTEIQGQGYNKNVRR